MNPQDPIERLRAQLDEAASGLDAETCARLTRARQTALEQAPRRWTLAPAPGLWLASACAVALVAVLVWPQTRAPVPTAVIEDEFELLADADELELSQDLEFYAWLQTRIGEG